VVRLADKVAELLDRPNKNVKICVFLAANAQKAMFLITPINAFQSSNVNAYLMVNFIKPNHLEFLTAMSASVTKVLGSVAKTIAKNRLNAAKTSFTVCAWTLRH
jgi:hypothetical protein